MSGAHQAKRRGRVQPLGARYGFGRIRAATAACFAVARTDVLPSDVAFGGCRYVCNVTAFVDDRRYLAGMGGKLNRRWASHEKHGGPLPANLAVCRMTAMSRVLGDGVTKVARAERTRIQDVGTFGFLVGRTGTGPSQCHRMQ